MVGNEMRCLRRGNDDQVMNRTRASDPSFPRMCSAHGDSRTAKAPDLEDTPHGGCEAWDWWEPGDDKCRVHERFYSAPAPGIRASGSAGRPTTERPEAGLGAERTHGRGGPPCCRCTLKIQVCDQQFCSSNVHLRPTIDESGRYARGNLGVLTFKLQNSRSRIDT